MVRVGCGRPECGSGYPYPGQLDGGLRVVGTCLTADDWVVISSGRGLRPGITVKPDFGKGLPDRSPALAARTGAGVAAAEQFVDLLSRGDFEGGGTLRRYDEEAGPARRIEEDMGATRSRRREVPPPRASRGPGQRRPPTTYSCPWSGNTTPLTSEWCLTRWTREKKISGLWIVPPKAGSMPPGKTTTASQSPLEARLPNGVTVELLGMAESPSKDRPWWRLDGSPLAGRPYDSLGDPMVAGPNETVRELAVQLDHVPAEPVSSFWLFGGGIGVQLRWRPGRPMRPGIPAQLQAVSLQVPDAAETLRAEFCLAAGTWETIAQREAGPHAQAVAGDGLRMMTSARSRRPMAASSSTLPIPGNSVIVRCVSSPWTPTGRNTPRRTRAVSMPSPSA